MKEILSLILGILFFIFLIIVAKIVAENIKYLAQDNVCDALSVIGGIVTFHLLLDLFSRN